MGFFKALFGGRSSGLGVDELARRIGIVAADIPKIKPTYQQFAISKRSGGTRQILAPDEVLKAVQRKILFRILARLKTHPAAKGFQTGQSIVTNALPHAGKRVVLRMDLQEFFTTTTAKRVEAYFRKIGWNTEAAALLTKLCTHKGGLPQGAPTSPRLSNLVNYRLDARLAGLAAKKDAVYTRYADDLTFSTNSKNHDTLELVWTTKKVVAEEGYTLHLKSKLQIRRSHEQQRVTGLVVNAGVKLPRQTRRWLRAVEHHVKKGIPATLTKQQLQGWRALQAMIKRQGSSQ